MKMKLSFVLVFSLLSLAVLLAITIPFDIGKYGQTFKRQGLPGFALLPSVLGFQLWYFSSLVLLLPLAIRRARVRGFSSLAGRLRRVGILLAVASAAYITALVGLFGLQGMGMFGWAPAAVLFLLIFCPSGLCLAIGSVVALRLGVSARGGAEH